MTTKPVTFRLDDGHIEMLDEIVAFMRFQAGKYGLVPTRTDALRYVLMQWSFDHHETVLALLAEAEGDNAE